MAGAAIAAGATAAGLTSLAPGVVAPVIDGLSGPADDGAVVVVVVADTETGTTDGTINGAPADVVAVGPDVVAVGPVVVVTGPVVVVTGAAVVVMIGGAVVVASTVVVVVGRGEEPEMSIRRMTFPLSSVT